MFAPAGNIALQKTTSYKVVLPFYIYAAVSFFVACILLLTSTAAFHQHYFTPQTLALTHILALGWGTMIILGASHQLVPVLIEGKLFSNTLAYLAFLSAGLGIPMLVYGFYTFNMGWPAITGAIAINIAVLCYLVNLAVSMFNSKSRNVAAVFILTATAWLLLTTLFGLTLVCNFTDHILTHDSQSYLTLHAHMGIAGWFLLLVLGVGSRLIPLFLISKYTNNRLLWLVYGCINIGLLGFIASQVFGLSQHILPLFVILVFSGILLFILYCFMAHKERIRNKVDEQMKVSLLSVWMMLLPVVCLVSVLIFFLLNNAKYNLVLLYGFCIFFGWLTAIIFGMTFKTLPFIVWNKVYHKRASGSKTPSPKELFNEHIFRWMTILYLIGFGLFVPGLIIISDIFLKTGAACLLFSALLYCLNVSIVILHKPRPL
jgi:hypothetical protein